jgi:hypothetical protein
VLPRPLLDRPKAEARKRRKRVTLIAAVRADDGIAICADSQETVGDYRRSVQKITPVKSGNLELVLAGAGNGDLIEGFIVMLSRGLPGANIETLEGFVTYCESTLATFYQTDVPTAAEDNRSLFLFIAASIPTRKEYQVWIARSTRLKPLGESDLLGWDETLYYRPLEHMRHEGISVAQAVLTVIHTVTIAEESSNYVRSPLAVAIVNSNGIAIEDVGYVQMLQGRLLEYEKRLDAVFLACADTSVYKKSLEEKLSAFATEAIQLHDDYTIQAIHHSLGKAISGEGHGDAYPKFPLGTRISARLTKDGPDIFNTEYRVIDEEDKKPEDLPGTDSGETK